MKNWGTDVIGKGDRIDVNNTYTSNGKRVVNLSIQLHNSCGDEVTFPVKGTIVVCEKPLKTVYAIWTLDGRSSVFNQVDDKFKLVVSG